MDRAPKLMVTADGSHTLYIESMDEHYHSVNGAVQESNHVFIQAGLDQVQKEEIHILEVGFGTGLNAFLTLLEAKRRGVRVRFITTELYPLGDDIVAALNFTAEYS
ncbi:MAG: tRNA (5-methylaminomethyl-2-thiouridine)(34)-methyltransferase MnmD, partial [Tannerellaceae bacterium]